MNKLLIKALVATAVVGVVGVAVAVAVDKHEEKKQVKEVEGVGTVAPFKPDQDESVLKRIKRFVNKKIIKGLAWVTVHMEQIEAAGAILGLAGTVISISGSIRDFVKNTEVNSKLDALDKKISALDDRERQRINNLGTYVNEEWNALDHNLGLVYDSVQLIADKVGVEQNETK